MSNWTDGRIPIENAIPFDFGVNYYYAWINYIIVLTLGVILNALALIFMFFDNKKSSKRSNTTVYLSYLAGQDFLACLTCLIQCAVNLHKLMIFGENIACIIEAWQVCFFVGISGFSVCLYGFYLRERTLTSKTKYVISLNNSSLLKVHLVAWLIYAILALFATYWPGKSRLLSSGTYCMPALEDPFAAVFFFGIIIFPCAAFLIVNYINIYSNYIGIKKDVAKDFGRERETNIKLLTQFFCFIAVYCFFYLPFLLAACYEWITGFHASAYFDLVAGIMTHGVSVMNPIMYVLTTKKYRILILKTLNTSRTRTESEVQTS